MIYLSMIVKNESAIIERCLKSVFPYVSGFYIADTGSTDDTVEQIHEIAEVHKMPGHILNINFENFAQARNKALDWARSAITGRGCYFLLMDADMELVVEDQKTLEDLSAPVYFMAQRSDDVEYWNIRLLKADSDYRYAGTTHESVVTSVHPSFPTKLKGAYFIDHADGSNRPGKAHRDIEILEKEAQDNARAWFYLANSYRDAGRTQDAIEAYRKRIALGGDDEEAYCAALYLARCLKVMGQ